MDPFDEDVIESEHTNVTGGSAPAPAETDGPPEATEQPVLKPQPVEVRPVQPQAEASTVPNPGPPSLAVKLGAWLILTIVCTIGLASIAGMGWLIYKGVRWAYFRGE